MPVPWPEKVPGTPKDRGPAIDAVENRAITVQQLRDLHAFIERLCKTRQLKRRKWKQEENEAGEEVWVDGGKEPLSVFEVNMYDITDEVIRPAIEYVEKKRADGLKERTTPSEPSLMEGYSWVELVSQGTSQEPDIMFSHSWQGRFQDFMTTVNKLERSLNYGGSKKIWICTFANNQFGENFGESLKDSPFHKAVTKVSKVVLVVDRYATSLQRTWCAFELHLALHLGKDLTIFTSMGKVGKEVKNGPLAEAIKHWDVTKTSAKEKADRRQILNYLAGLDGADEKKGLKLKEDGQTLDVDPDTKRKRVENEEEAKKLYEQRMEYEYEAGLFKTHRAVFDELNERIRANVRAAAVEKDCSAAPSAAPDLASSLSKADLAAGLKRADTIDIAGSHRKADRPSSAQSASAQRSPSKSSAAKLPSGSLQRSSSKGSLARSPTASQLHGGTPGSPSKSSGTVKLPPIQKQDGEPAAPLARKQEGDLAPRKQIGEPAAPPVPKKDATPVAPSRKVAMDMRGITLGEMRKAVKLLRDLHWKEYVEEFPFYSVEEKEKRGKADWKAKSVWEVVNKKNGFMYRLDRWKDDVYAPNESYAERVCAEGGHAPQYIINDSNDWGFQYTMDALEWMAEALQLTDSAVLFMSAFCVCDWDAEQEDFNTNIESLIRNSYGWITVLGLTKKSILRSNRMDQLQHCFRAARPIYFACDTGILAGLQPFIGTSYGHNGACWEFGVFNPRIARVLLKANWERDAISSSKKIKEEIADRIKQSPGGFASFEQRLACAAAGPVLRDAVADCANVDKVAKLCRRRGLRINSRLLRGALGETPLHIAAAVGNVGAMQVLMEAKADPNAEDNILETPMHYAAMSGHAAAASCLLSRGANARVESAYAESPLMVAQQNPAAFIWEKEKKEKQSEEKQGQGACQEEQSQEQQGNSVCSLLSSWETALNQMVEVPNSDISDDEKPPQKAAGQTTVPTSPNPGAGKQQAAPPPVAGKQPEAPQAPAAADAKGAQPAAAPGKGTKGGAS